MEKLDFSSPTVKCPHCSADVKRGIFNMVEHFSENCGKAFTDGLISTRFKKGQLTMVDVDNLRNELLKRTNY